MTLSLGDVRSRGEEPTLPRNCTFDAADWEILARH